MKSNLVLIGCDPEAFVRRGQTIHHCIGVVGGSKDAPRAVANGAVQEDNVLFEFNVDCTADAAVFSTRLDSVLGAGRNILRESGLHLVPNVSSHSYESMDGWPEQAFVFGCDPDYNGLTGEVNPKPSAEDPFLRTAGGHVHIGWSHLGEVTKELQQRVIVMCDYVLGLPSLSEDTDTRRRELYGKAGACRYKSYGVEYRTLSNYWIWSDAATMTTHRRAQRAFELAFGLGYDVLTALITPEEVQHAINTGDVAAAQAYLKVIENAKV